ncbi:hypothetical protein GCM10028817_26580 [Spirosoma pomorum]
MTGTVKGFCDDRSARILGVNRNTVSTQLRNGEIVSPVYVGGDLKMKLKGDEICWAAAGVVVRG